MDSERQLRSQFVRALDEVLPAAPWLDATVVEDLRRRQSGVAGAPRRVLSMPRPAMQWAVVVAALLVVAVVAGVLVIGSLRQPQSVPAGVAPLHMLAALQAQRLNHSRALPPSGQTVQVQTGPLAPGTHEYLDVDQQGFNVRFIVPAGWTWNGRYLSKGTAAIYFFGGPVQVYADPCRWASGPSSPTIALNASRVVDALAAQPFRNASAQISLPIIAAGWVGVAIELSVPGDLNFATCDQGQFRSWGPEKIARSHQAPGQLDLVWAADVPGSGAQPGGLATAGGLIIDAAYFPGTPGQVRSELVTILGSIEAGHWG